MKWFKNSEWSWGKFLFEIVTILIGVVLALGLNEWRQSRAQDEQLSTALQLIRNEVEMNHHTLSDRISYWEAMRDTLDRLMQRQGNIDLSHVPIPGWKGTRNPALSESALEAATGSQALSTADVTLVKRIITVYTFQKKYSQFSDLYFQAGLNGHLQQSRQLYSMLSDHSISGRELLKAYDQLLTYLPHERSATSDSVE
jgi:hypothetical protein